MCLNAARLPARLDTAGNLNSMFEQDRSRWDQELIDEGLRLLDLSATGSELSHHHIEAAIASEHALASKTEDTDWARIVSLYDTLMTTHPSPIVALNRAIAVAQSEGPERGLEEIRAIADGDRLSAYPFYSAALGEFELRSGRPEIAREHFRAALALARNPMERRFLDQRLIGCEQGETPQAYWERFWLRALVSVENHAEANSNSKLRSKLERANAGRKDVNDEYQARPRSRSENSKDRITPSGSPRLPA
jgi:RNA polymerase sigma-70 factor (ECF subfamily)